MSWKYYNKSEISSERMLEVLRRPVVTEKSTMMNEQQKYCFEVAVDATKAEIKQAVEKLFSVGVTAVNTLNQKGKNKRFRGKIGHRKDSKKAIVTLNEGDVIDVTVGL